MSILSEKQEEGLREEEEEDQNLKPATKKEFELEIMSILYDNLGGTSRRNRGETTLPYGGRKVA